MKDLYYKYKFTDRGGLDVYDVYRMPKDMEIMMPPDCIMAEMRMEPLEEPEMVTLSPNASND